MSITEPARSDHDGRRRGGGVLMVVVALLAAGTWFAWFGWDTTYQVDADGNASGPYETWQGVGAALTLLVLTVVAALRLGTWRTAVPVTVGFTVGFAVTSGTQDDTGLWLVGAILVAVGLLVGTALVAALTVRVRRNRH